MVVVNLYEIGLVVQYGNLALASFVEALAVSPSIRSCTVVSVATINQQKKLIKFSIYVLELGTGAGRV